MSTQQAHVLQQAPLVLQPTPQIAPQKQSFSQDVYEGAASFGKFQAGLGIFFAILFGGLFISIGVYIIRQPAMISVQANVVSVNTSPTGPCCFITVSYQYQESKYINNIPTTSQIISMSTGTNPTMTIYFVNGNPNDITASGPIPKKYGWGFVIAGALVIIISILHYWIVSKYKIAAVGTGVGGAIGMGRVFI